MTIAFIIDHKKVICVVDTEAKSGQLVYYADQVIEGYIDGVFKRTLKNTRIGKMSRAKKYIKQLGAKDIKLGLCLNPDSGGPKEFLI